MCFCQIFFLFCEIITIFYFKLCKKFTYLFLSGTISDADPQATTFSFAYAELYEIEFIGLQRKAFCAGMHSVIF